MTTNQLKKDKNPVRETYLHVPNRDQKGVVWAGVPDKPVMLTLGFSVHNGRLKW